MKKNIFLASILWLITSLVPVWAAEGQTVSVEEFNKLKADYNELKQEVQQLKQLTAQQQQNIQSQVTQNQAVANNAPAASEEYVNTNEFKKLKDEVKKIKPGLSNFMLTGYGFTDYIARKGNPSTFSGGDQFSGSHSSFVAGVNPIFLWQPIDKLLFESELELSLEDSDTKINLEYADATYILNDYITLGAGKFLSPFGIFTSRLHPKPNNKLTDKPFGYPDGSAMLAPESEIGAKVSGGFPLFRESKANYALYVANGPTLHTDPASPKTIGELSFTNTNDNNQNKAFGGRVGFLPIPALEMGYSWEVSRVSTKGDTNLVNPNSRVDALLQGVDLSYVRDFDLIKGSIDFRAEQTWSHVDPVNYGTAGGTFKNDRWAHWIQLAYRPSKINLSIIKNFEPVFRFDQIDQPKNAPDSIDRTRYTYGLDYWFTPSTVAKIAYESDNQSAGGGNQHAITAELAVGF